MITSTIEEALNQQINAELYSAYLYYAMAAHCESQSLVGCAHYLRVQALEELTHVQKFFAYVHERGGQVRLAAIDAPPSDWESPRALFQAVYEHEEKVTGLVNRLMSLAQSEHDHATCNFLQWFVGEQVEEEASADQVVQRLKLVEQSEGGLFLLDQELNQRTFTAPPDVAAAF